MRKKLAILLSVGFLSACGPSTPALVRQNGSAQLSMAPPEVGQSFERVTEPIEFSFPVDHGDHPAFQTEWWYYTGNLDTEAGERFSYQLTIFRRGLTREATERESNFSTNQVYFAHFALASIDQREHRHAERFSRDAVGLAGASQQPFEIYLENWRIRALDEEGRRVHLTASDDDLALDLELQALKPIVIHGEGGVSAKSGEVGNASYYLSYTRMDTHGSIQFGGEKYRVRGTSWFDHEWSTSALGEGVVGWDWFSLQFEDQQELMLYVLRRVDGSVEPVSAGTLVRQDGSLRHLVLEDFSIEVLDQWESRESGTLYPSRWIVSIPDELLELEITPTFNEQEMLVSFIYWEGSVTATGIVNGVPITGRGFVELTGYAESMEGIF